MKEGAFMYETKKLYYEDVYKKEFTAKVLECRESKKGYEIILNARLRTALINSAARPFSSSKDASAAII